MRKFVLFSIVLIVCITSCDSNRVYEKNHDFTNRLWAVTELPVFEFTVTDTVRGYNLYCNLRNTLDYPYSRIFINYALQDSMGNSLEKALVSNFLFDEKTGKPTGNSGVGDLYDQQIVLLNNYTFKKPGLYKVQFEQFMRTDSLTGILAIGLRVETSAPNE